jgi:RNA polymerase sigma-70 factor (ECF subfamily)
MEGIVARDSDGGVPAVLHDDIDAEGRRGWSDVRPADDDAVLVQSLRRGRNDQAAHALFDRYAALVRRILARMLGPFQDVEDHVQETFLAFFRQVGAIRDQEAVHAFVVSIAVRIARHELRRRRVRRILRLAPNEQLPEAAVGGVGDVEAREALRRLFAILDDLDGPSRIAFSLRHLEEMELMEVALATGESLASVKRRLARVVPIVNARIANDSALATYVRGGGVS